MIDDITASGSVPRTRAGDDFDRPASARVYDFLLGGGSHGALDRALARRMMILEPRVVEIVRENRAFLRRAVDLLVDAGIDQFLDLGSGIPTMGSVGEVARRRAPEAHVVHVDVDPVVAAHAEHLLASSPGIATVRVDLRDVDAVMATPEVGNLLDLDRPVGLLMFSVLQHVPDADDPAGLVARYLERLAPGSALAMSHLTAEDPRLDVARLVDATRDYPGGGGLRPRSRTEVAELVTGVTLVSPGLVRASEWRPEPARGGRTDICGHHGAVGFLPDRPHHDRPHHDRPHHDRNGRSRRSA